MKDIKPTRTVAVMMGITIIGKLLGLLRDRMQTTEFGAYSAEGIAFMQASALPRNFLDIMFAAAFSASFIPVFSSYMETKGKEAAFDLAARFISVVMVLSAAVVVLGVIFARPIFMLSLDGDALPYGTVSLGVTLLRHMLPLMILSGLAFSFTGILQSLGEFRMPAAMSIVSNGIILAYYFFFIDRFGVYGLAVAFLIGWGAQGVIQLPFLVRHKFRFRFSLNLRDPGLRQIGALALPVLVSSWIVPINNLVNARAASPLYGGEFGVVGIYMAHALFTIATGVFVLSIANVIFPKLSRLAAVEDKAGFGKTVNDTVRVLLFFLVPLTLGLMALSHPLVELVYGGGRFDAMAIDVTSTALFYLAIGAVGYGLLIVLSRACYATFDGRTPIMAAVVAIGANAVLSFALAPYLDVAGPAIAAAVSQILGAAILVVALTRKGVLKWPRAMIFDIVKILGCAGVMYVAVVFVLRQVDNAHVFVQVALAGAVGLGLYFGLAWVVGMKKISW